VSVPDLRVVSDQRLSIQLVDQYELRAGTWDLIQPKLILVRDKCKATWRLEDIYAMLVNGNAFCFIFYKGDAFVGFTILRKDTDTWTNEKLVLSYASWFDNFDEVAENVVKFYDDIAHDMGVHLIRFCSPRIGWKGKKHGCEISTVIWERRTNGRQG